ncbi:putative Insulin-degrading enzyme like protein [Fusarium oxysporum f. sp. albedinis]|nr:putative Insulin-degrading enzyme like protein [Fusarium oxysporum f. sp. albedinis]
MEIVGVIATVPGLIEIVKAAITAVRGLSKRKVAAKTAADLVVQLRDLEGILEDVQKGWKQGGPGQVRLQRLSPSTTQLRTELDSLQHVLVVYIAQLCGVKVYIL